MESLPADAPEEPDAVEALSAALPVVVPMMISSVVSAGAAAAVWLEALTRMERTVSWPTVTRPAVASAAVVPASAGAGDAVRLSFGQTVMPSIQSLQSPDETNGEASSTGSPMLHRAAQR